MTTHKIEAHFLYLASLLLSKLLRPALLITAISVFLGLNVSSLSAHPALPLDEVNAFEESDVAVFGGWQRGDSGSVYAGWDIFEANPDPVSSDDSTADGYVTVAEKQLDINALPAFTSFGATSSSIIATPGLGIFKTSSDNWYSFSDAPEFSLLVASDSAHQALTGPVTVVFQLANLGADIDDSSIQLLGVDHDNNLATSAVDIPFYSKRTLYIGETIDGDGNPVPDGAREYLYSWELDYPQAVYVLQFTAEDTSMSLDAVAFDAGPRLVISENVPVLPMPFSLGLAGLLLILKLRYIPGYVR